MMTDQMNNTFDNAVEVHHRITIIPKVTPHRIDIVLQQEIELIMTEDLLLKIIQVPDMITINKVLDPIVLFINHTDHLTDVILVQERIHVLIQEATILQNILLHLHLLQDQESRYSRSSSHSNPRNNVNTVQPQSTNDPLKFEVHITTLQKWLMP